MGAYFMKKQINKFLCQQINLEQRKSSVIYIGFEYMSRFESFFEKNCYSASEKLKHSAMFQNKF